MNKGQEIYFYNNQNLLSGVIVDILKNKIIVELEDKSQMVIDDQDII